MKVMTCPGAGSTGSKTTGALFQNWARTRQRVVPTTFHPTTVMEVVAAVQETEQRKGRLKALGSGWSYTGVAVDDSTTHVIDTAALSNILTATAAQPPTAVIPFALKDALQSDMQHYVHVEGGIKIDVLNCRLHAMGLAMPTLGASNGQSLAGAISTGTHGSHTEAPPIADAVRAIHLVGPGGQEWWIERGGAESLTDPARMEQARALNLLCSDIKVEYDTLLFRAVLVSLGRMGVVYSYVVRAVDAYRLVENRRRSTWTDEQAILRNQLDPYQGNAFIEVFLNPYPDPAGKHACTVTTRNPAPGAQLSLAELPRPDPFDSMCRTPAMTEILVGVNLSLAPLMATALTTAVSALSTLNLIPVVGPILFATASSAAIIAITEVYVRLQTAVGVLLVESPNGNFGEQLATVVNLLVLAGQQQVIPAIVSSLGTTLRPMTRADDSPLHPFVGDSFRLLTSQRPCPQPILAATNCERQMDTLELSFDMSAGRQNLFQFLDAVIALSNSFYAAGTPAAFGISLRFTGKTEALLGMQQFSRTAAVEIFLLRGVTANDRFMREVFAIGERNGSIPHWGLVHELSSARVRAVYADASEWRQQLQRLITEGGGREETFRSDFSLLRGLEPESFQPPLILLADSASGMADSYDFGTMPRHARRSETFHFANGGAHTLELLDATAAGDFSTDDVPASSLLGTLQIPHNLELQVLNPTAQPGEEIKLTATFIAERAGPHQGSITLHTNAANFPAGLKIPIRAKVESFTVSVVSPLPPAGLDFGLVAVADTKVAQLVLRNDGTQNAYLASYAFSDPAVGLQIGIESGGIAAGQTRAFALAYRPDTVGQLASDLTLHFTAGMTPSPHAYDVTVRLSANAAGVQAALSPAELDFGLVPVGVKSVPTPMFLRNTGSLPLTVTSSSFDTSFRVSGVPTSLPPGQTAQIDVSFRPVRSGPTASGFTIESDSVRPPTPVQFRGFGVDQPLLHADPESIAFRTVEVGNRSDAVKVLLRNDSGYPVKLSYIALTGAHVADFGLNTSMAPRELPSGDGCELQVLFEPVSAGAKQVVLEVLGTAPPLNIAITGEAVPAGALAASTEWSAALVDFDNLVIGVRSPRRQVYLRNVGARSITLSLSELRDNGDFVLEEADPSVVVLPPNSEKYLYVWFKPQVTGTCNGTVWVHSDAAGSPHPLPLTGVGHAAVVP